ncbi:hypothetical protein [Actinoplanes sp. NPDC049118]
MTRFRQRRKARHGDVQRHHRALGDEVTRLFLLDPVAAVSRVMRSG